MWKTLAISTLLLSACTATDDDADFDLDRGAVEEGADGKADTYTFTRLERVTPAAAAKSVSEHRGPELGECFTAYKAQFDATATKLSNAVAAKFISLDNDTVCQDWSFMQELVKGVLADKGLTEATLSTVQGGIEAWAKPQLAVGAIAGNVNIEKVSVSFYYDVKLAETAKSIEREKNPTGVDINAVREQWKEVRDETTLDTMFLNPVTFPAGVLDGPKMFSYLRAAFPLRGLALQSTSFTAVKDFSEAGEGPDGDPAFKPIATALRKSSIKKRFYFAKGGEWSSNVMIVVDQHGQAWGMQMGYSE